MKQYIKNFINKIIEVIEIATHKKVTKKQVLKKIENAKHIKTKDEINFKFTNEQIQNSWNRVVDKYGKSK